MRAGFPVMVVGFVIAIFGFIFFLQGNSVLGPTTSFMYSNSRWIENGQWITVAGIIILAVGIAISLRRQGS